MASGRFNPCVCAAIPVKVSDRFHAMDQESLAAAQSLIGHQFNNTNLLADALMHASLADHRLNSNERMEFLGDAVLAMVVCEYLYRSYPNLLEGDLTKIKSSAVSRRSCANISREIGLDSILRLGKGMSRREGLPESIAAAAFEAVTAAIFLDAGMEAARSFVLRFLIPVIERNADSGHQFNFKSVLQQWVQQQSDDPATYVLVSHTGPDHAKRFEVCVAIGERRFTAAWAASKKQGEQKAALNALLELNVAQLDPQTGLIHLRQTSNSHHQDRRAESETSTGPEGGLSAGSEGSTSVTIDQSRRVSA